MLQINKSELKELRELFYKEQGGVCPLLNQKIPIENMVIDHKHRKKSTPVGENGAGMIRGVIQRSANVIEGKLSNSYIRYGLHKFDITLPDFLRNLADYLENPPLESEFLIHPSEKPKEPKLKKSCYNKLKKIIGYHCPNYPKSGRVTKSLQKAFDQAKIEPEYYKT